MTNIRESDWKVFKELHPVALERYFMRALANFKRIANNDQKTNRERFWDLHEASKAQGKEVHEIFDDYRRSTAVLMVLRMRSEGLITPEELKRFSPELQQWTSAVFETIRDSGDSSK